MLWCTWNVVGTLLLVRSLPSAYADHVETLNQVYDRILAGLTGLESLTPTDAKAELNTLVQLLEEGTSDIGQPSVCIYADSQRPTTSLIRSSSSSSFTMPERSIQPSHLRSGGFTMKQ